MNLLLSFANEKTGVLIPSAILAAFGAILGIVPYAPIHNGFICQIKKLPASLKTGTNYVRH